MNMSTVVSDNDSIHRYFGAVGTWRDVVELSTATCDK